MKLPTLLVCALLPVVPVSALADETLTYQYDELGRLIVVDRSGTANNGAQSAYALDAAGNRLGSAVGDSSAGSNPAVEQLCLMDLPQNVKTQLNCQ